MPTRSAAGLGNSVVKAVEMACAIYGVRCYRQQSRAVTVVGVGGRLRPMFMGQWRDRNGALYSRGMADLLLTPWIGMPTFGHCEVLWVECKAGTGELSKEQKAFRDDVKDVGAHYIECRDSADPVVAWFDRHSVRRA